MQAKEQSPEAGSKGIDSAEPAESKGCRREAVRTLPVTLSHQPQLSRE